MAPQISINELYRLQQKKKQIRVKSFIVVLEKCHNRIRNVATQGGMCCFYEVPGLVVGMPLYNVDECIEYVVNSLRKDKFLVQILPPPHIGVLYISWNPQELRPPKPALRYTPTTTKDQQQQEQKQSQPIPNRFLGR